MKTAIQEAIEIIQLAREGEIDTDFRSIKYRIEQLLEKEKQQIMSAYWDGLEGFMNSYDPRQEGEQWPKVKQTGGGAEDYYNETFKTE